MISVLQAMAGAQVGGAEAFFERLVAALPKERIDQTVVVRRNVERQKRLNDAGLETVGLRFGGALDIATRSRLRRVITRCHPKVIFAWMNRASSMCPREVEGERYALVGRLGGYYKLKYYAHCHHLVANTRGIETYLLHAGWDRGRVHYLPNFVEAYVGRRTDRADWGFPHEVPLLLAAGRLHANKGFDVLVKALGTIGDAHLCIAGAGPLEASLKKLAETLGVADRISWLGWVNELGPLYQLADLFVCPSRHEPLGNVVLEAWANGCPVVAAASQGPTELIVDGANGILIPVEDHNGLARAVNDVLGDPAVGETLAKNGLDSFHTGFSRDVVVERYTNFLETVAP